MTVFFWGVGRRSLYIYIYIYIYLYIYGFCVWYTRVYIYIYICTHIYTRAHTFKCIRGVLVTIEGNVYSDQRSNLDKAICISYIGRCPWCNGYRRRKWTRRHEFKSWTRLIAFHIALIPLIKV